MIVGGSEAAITPMGVGGFAAMRALSTRNDDPETASRPWDRERDGFVIGEGAGILVLEDLEFARNRGAKILSEIIGYGMSADAYHITQPAEEGEGGWRVMTTAIKDAKLTPADIDYVNAQFWHCVTRFFHQRSISRILIPNATWITCRTWPAKRR